MAKRQPLLLLLLFFLKLSSLQPILSLDFVYNGFETSNILLYGDATIDSNILILRNISTGNIGWAFFLHKIPSKSPNQLLPFYTSFIFSLADPHNDLENRGFAFIFSHLRPTLLESNSVFGNIGVVVNMRPTFTTSGSTDTFVVFDGLKISNGVNYQVWVDYSNSLMNVSMALAGTERPRRPFISTYINFLALHTILDEMYVGFSSTYIYSSVTQRILAWSFSNSNPRIGDALITSHLPTFVPRGSSSFLSRGSVVSIVVATVSLISCGLGICFVLYRKRTRTSYIEGIEEWEVEYWPHRIAYQDIQTATKGFSEENLLGSGGIGKVYKGVMLGGVEVAVKCISHGTSEGMREFLAEISSLGRLKHRNLVGFIGWCKGEERLILVYEFMENGSLDKRIFDCDESMLLSWGDRVRVLKDVAEAVFYLHEGWESKVLHRDIKASNVMLDKDMNGKLGDFGLARMHGHGQAPSTTLVMGTAGYMAPEIIRYGRASAQTDVFGFGALVLEVVTGRRPIEDGKPFLVDWVRGLMENGEIMNALDPKLNASGEFDTAEVERVLHLGQLCTCPDALSRPTMRQVLKVLNGTSIEKETDGEGMEMRLLDKIESTAMWSNSRQNRRDGTHPTIAQIQLSYSLSRSDMFLEGR